MEAVGENAPGGTTCIESTFVSSGIYAKGKAGDNNAANFADLRCARLSGSYTPFRRVASSDDCQAGLRLWSKVATRVQQCRWVLKSRQLTRVPRRAISVNAQPKLGAIAYKDVCLLPRKCKGVWRLANAA